MAYDTNAVSAPNITNTGSVWKEDTNKTNMKADLENISANTIDTTFLKIGEENISHTGEHLKFLIKLKFISPL